jgi:hypothetical protein
MVASEAGDRKDPFLPLQEKHPLSRVARSNLATWFAAPIDLADRLV